MMTLQSDHGSIPVRHGVQLREVHEQDITELFVIRSSTGENAIPISDMYRMGITMDSMKDRLITSHKGWVGEVDGKPVGFAIGDTATGEVWMIAVLPAYEGRGIGRALLEQVEECLFDRGSEVAWIRTTNIPAMRSYRFLRQAGWEIWHEEGIECVFKKVKP